MNDTTISSAGQLAPVPILPLTPAQWGTRIDDEVAGKRGRFKFLERQAFSSRAYRSLSLPAREILLCYLNHVKYEKRPKQHGPGNRRHTGTSLNSGNLVVTNNEIKARGGVRSDSTIAKARQELVDCGFLDVVRPGAFPQPGIFALSSRFLQYPNGDYRAPDNMRAGVPRYSRKCTKGRRGFSSHPSSSSRAREPE